MWYVLFLLTYDFRANTGSIVWWSKDIWSMHVCVCVSVFLFCFFRRSGKRAYHVRLAGSTLQGYVGCPYGPTTKPTNFPRTFFINGQTRAGHHLIAFLPVLIEAHSRLLCIHLAVVQSTRFFKTQYAPFLIQSSLQSI